MGPAAEQPKQIDLVYHFDLWYELTFIKVLSGPAYGLREPVLLARYLMPSTKNTDWRLVDGIMGQCVDPPPLQQNVELALLSRMVAWAYKVQNQAGLPLYEHAKVLAIDGVDDRREALLAIPYAPGRPAEAVASCKWSARVVALFASTTSINYDSLREQIRIDLDILNEKLKVAASKNLNTNLYLKAAFIHAIPYIRIFGDVYQFGWGINSRMMLGSFSDETSNVGAVLARDKRATAEVLRVTGLPTPPHYLANSEDEAEQIALQLGFPVVVKPADMDGGLGVAAGLDTAPLVRAAWTRASRFSSCVLVEKHIGGQDYRLTVFQGEMVWAVLRRPAGVDGDGVHTVRELVDQLNADPRRGNDTGHALKTLTLDHEAFQLLTASGLTEASIPGVGEFIRLCRVANINRGGTPFAVTEVVHDENRQLAIKAANALRLDIAGIDLIIEDISLPWYEAGGVINEVNADPQLGSVTQNHLHGNIINKLVGGFGRVPVIVLIGPKEAIVSITNIVNCELSTQKIVGYADGNYAKVAGLVEAGPACRLFDATRLLIANKRVEVLMIATDNEDLIETSLPVDLIDVLVIAGRPTCVTPGGMRRLLLMLGPNSKSILHCEEDGFGRWAVQSFQRAKVCRISQDAKCIALAALDAANIV